MNEVEANKKSQDMIAERIHIYCPLMKGLCVTSCECYKMPEVYHSTFNGHERNDNNSFEVRHGFCTCYALKGASD